jgi:hypothetical protein
MHGIIKGIGDGLTFSVAARARLVQGAGNCGLDDEARLQSPDFVKVLQQTAEQCAWKIVPTGEAKATATLNTVRTDSARELRLEIGWPHTQFLRAEQLLELVLSEGGTYSIYFPVPLLHRGFPTEEEPYSHGDLMSGRKCALVLSSELPALTVSFPGKGVKG